MKLQVVSNFNLTNNEATSCLQAQTSQQWNYKLILILNNWKWCYKLFSTSNESRMKIQVVSNFNLTDSFLLFSGFSGMRLNPAKSQGFFCSMDDSVTNDILQKYGFTRGTLPINYLCLPLITSRLNEQLCSPLIQKLCWKIESWSVRCLRYSGRLQLISSVLQGIHGY